MKRKIPIDGSPSKEAYEVFAKMFGKDMMDKWDAMLKGGWTAETIASYAAGQVPETAYNLQLSALRWREATIR